MEHFFDIAQQLISAGFGVWSIILFIQVRKLKKAELKLDTIVVYQKIAESNNQTLLKQNDKIIFLEEEIGWLKEIVSLMVNCKDFAICPSRVLLQNYKQKYFRKQTRQPRMEQKGIRYARDNPHEPGRVDNPDGQPP